MVNHAHVAGVHNGYFPRPRRRGNTRQALLLHQGVPVAAGLGAGSPVGVPAGHIVGEEAGPEWLTHGPWTKHSISRSMGVLARISRISSRELPGQNDALGAQVVPGGGALEVYDAGLGGDVDVQMGAYLFARARVPTLGHDDGVDPEAVQVLQPSGRRDTSPLRGMVLQVTLTSTPRAAQSSRPPPAPPGEIAREGPHSKLVSGQIDGIGPVGHRHAQPLHVARRTQHLRPGMPARRAHWSRGFPQPLL